MKALSHCDCDSPEERPSPSLRPLLHSSPPPLPLLSLWPLQAFYTTYPPPPAPQGQPYLQNASPCSPPPSSCPSQQRPPLVGAGQRQNDQKSVHGTWPSLQQLLLPPC